MPGHDTYQFIPGDDGWTLRGSAVFFEAKQMCLLHYQMVADSAVQTREATVAGWLGDIAVDLRIHVNGEGEWTVNGVEQASSQAVQI